MNPVTLASRRRTVVAAAPLLSSAVRHPDAPAMQVRLALSDRDLRQLRAELRKTSAAVRCAETQEILEMTRQPLAALRRAELPDFMRERLAHLDLLYAMLADASWEMDESARSLALAVLVYVCDPEDLIADDVPGIGLLDDALMIDVACHELRAELEAYRRVGLPA